MTVLEVENKHANHANLQTNMCFTYLNMRSGNGYLLCRTFLSCLLHL